MWVVWAGLIWGCSGDARSPRVAGPDPGDSEPDPAPLDTAPETEPAPALQISSAEIFQEHALPLERTVTVSTNVPSTASLRCTSVAEPAEDHRLEAPGVAMDHRFVVGGLLAETPYRCTVTARAAHQSELAALEAHTGPLPDDAPVLRAVGDPGAVTAYTIFNHRPDDVTHRVFVVDPEGRIRWIWHSPTRELGLEATLGPDGLLLVGGGMGVTPRLLDASAVERWVGPEPSNGGRHHHDVNILPDGTFLTLATATNAAGDDGWKGFLVEAVDPDDERIVWSWNSQLAVDAGTLPHGGGVPDPYHANAVTWVDDDDGAGFVVSLPGLDRLLRVDPGSGAVLWQLGVGLDFQLLDPQGAPAADPAAWFYFQHGHELEADRLLLYDNGTGRPGGPPAYSRVLELALDRKARTARVVWTWTEPGWFEPALGDVDWLPNGHVLVTRAHREGNGSPDDTRSAVIELDPTDDREVHRLEFAEGTDTIYRADRIDGCALFANAAYCPAESSAGGY